VTQNLSSVYQFRKIGSGQFLQPRQLFLSPGLAKIAPWWLGRRDSFLAKEPGLVTAGCATNAFCSYPLAVICKVFSMISRYPTHKQEFGSPSPQPSSVTAKHMLFNLPGPCCLDNFIMTRSACPSTGTLPPRQLYHYETSSACQPGLAKTNHSQLTLPNTCFFCLPKLLRFYNFVTLKFEPRRKEHYDNNKLLRL